MSSYYRDGATEPVFAKACLTLAEAIGAKITEEQIRLHAQLMEGVPFEQLQHAFRRAALELPRGFYPTPGQLLAYARPTADDSALLAWAVLNQTASAAGAWTDVELEDPAAAEAVLVAFGSWPAFCQTEEGPALALKRQEFLAAYRNALRTPKPSQGVTLLRGLCETPPELAEVTWTARVGLGGVSLHRTRPALPAGSDRQALGEG